MAFDDFLLRTGVISQDELTFRRAPAEIRKEVVTSIEKCQDISLFSNITDAVKAVDALDKRIDGIFTKYNYPSRSANAMGAYEPGGSTIKKLYPNPFAPHVYVAENYWAAFKARREQRIEILRDNYVLVAPEGVGKKRIKLVNEILEDMGVKAFRADAADHLSVVGNCWIDNSTVSIGGKRGIAKLQLLLPEFVVPVLDEWGVRVIGWKYEYGNRLIDFTLKEIDHLRTNSMRSLDLGTPALQSVIVDIEADMYASIYSATVFKKGGLIRAIVAMDKIEDTSLLNDNSYLALVAKMQQWFERMFSGVRGSGQIVFTPNVTGVHNLVNPKDLEGAHAQTSERTAIKVCELLGCPPERIGLTRTSQYQNNALIDDSVSLSFDNNVYFNVGIVDDYINKKILQETLGEENIRLQMSGEYGSISKNAAEFGKAISDMGSNVMTVDEFRVKVLHWEPIGGTEGKAFLGDIKNKIEMMKASKPAAPAGKGLIVHYPDQIKYY